MKKEHLGSSFDDFLREENLLDVTEATAAKRVIAFQIAKAMEKAQVHQVGDGQPDEDKPAGTGKVAGSHQSVVTLATLESGRDG